MGSSWSNHGFDRSIRIRWENIVFSAVSLSRFYYFRFACFILITRLGNKTLLFRRETVAQISRFPPLDNSSSPLFKPSLASSSSVLFSTLIFQGALKTEQRLWQYQEKHLVSFFFTFLVVLWLRLLPDYFPTPAATCKKNYWAMLAQWTEEGEINEQTADLRNFSVNSPLGFPIVVGHRLRSSAPPRPRQISELDFHDWQTENYLIFYDRIKYTLFPKGKFRLFSI